MERLMNLVARACIEKAMEANAWENKKQFELWSKAAFDIVGALRAIRTAIENERSEA